MFVAETDLAVQVKIDDETLKLWRRQGKDAGEYGWRLPGIREAVERVNRGAALLDDVNVGWEDQVAPENLRMSSGDWCIIGQVYNNYDDDVGFPFGIGELGDGNTDEAHEKAKEHGFMESEYRPSVHPVREVPFALLDRVWVYLLTTRAQHTNPHVYLAL